jgi:hypothetical protein
MNRKIGIALLATTPAGGGTSATLAGSKPPNTNACLHAASPSKVQAKCQVGGSVQRNNGLGNAGGDNVPARSRLSDVDR